jgi:lipopolysaccharide exporter
MVARLTQRGFVRGVMVLVGGAAGAQAINAAISPVLTRLYAPDEIGLLGLYLVFISVGSIVLSMRYEQAIVVPAADGVAARLASVALWLILPMTVVVGSVLLAFITADIAGYGVLPAWSVPLAAVTLAAFGVSAVLRHWLLRMGRFDVIAGVLVGQSLGRGVSQVGLGAVGLGLPGLLVGEAIGRLLGLGRMLRVAMPGLRRAMQDPVSIPTTRIAGGFAQFPVAGVPSSLLNALAFHIPTPLIAAAYGLPVAGFFSLVQRVLGVPLSVIGASVGDALLQRVSQHARDAPDQALRLFRLTALGLLALAVPLAVVVIVLAPLTFAFIFGEEWRFAGTLAAVMAPWYAAAVVVSPLSRVVLVYRGQATKLIYDVLSLGVAIASISLAASQGLAPVMAVWYLSLGQAGAYGVYLVILYRMVLVANRPSSGIR